MTGALPSNTVLPKIKIILFCTTSIVLAGVSIVDDGHKVVHGRKKGIDGLQKKKFSSKFFISDIVLFVVV